MCCIMISYGLLIFLYLHLFLFFLMMIYIFVCICFVFPISRMCVYIYIFVLIKRIGLRKLNFRKPSIFPSFYISQQHCPKKKKKVDKRIARLQLSVSFIAPHKPIIGTQKTFSSSLQNHRSWSRKEKEKADDTGHFQALSLCFFSHLTMLSFWNW